MKSETCICERLSSNQRSGVGLVTKLGVTVVWGIAIIYYVNAGILEAQTTEVASDNFNRPNGPIGTNWADTLASQGNFIITNDVVGVDTENAHVSAYWSSNSFSNDQYSQALLTSIGPFTGVILRGSTNQDQFYMGFVFGPNDYRIYARYPAGGGDGYTELAAGSDVTWQLGDTLKLEVSGSTSPVTVTMFQNGTPVLIWRDPNSPVPVYTGGSPGLCIYSRTGAGLTIGSWEGGNLNPDTTPPSVPTDLVANVAGPSQIDLSWSPSTDDVGVVGYVLERSQGAGSTNFTQIATLTGTNYSDSGLAVATTYN
jgi:hypothetical protein